MEQEEIFDIKPQNNFIKPSPEIMLQLVIMYEINRRTYAANMVGFHRDGSERFSEATTQK